MRLIAAAVLLVLVACDRPTGQDYGRAPIDARARALDGDTLAIDLRLRGVDAFERRQMCARGVACWPCGKVAQDLAARSLRDRTATLRLTGEESHGRPVATVDVGGADLGETLIRAGLAIPAPRFLRDDAERATRYTAAYQAARLHRDGAHAGEWIDPAAWRRGERLTCER